MILNVDTRRVLYSFAAAAMAQIQLSITVAVAEFQFYWESLGLRPAAEERNWTTIY